MPDDREPKWEALQDAARSLLTLRRNRRKARSAARAEADFETAKRDAVYNALSDFTLNILQKLEEGEDPNHLDIKERTFSVPKVNRPKYRPPKYRKDPRRKTEKLS